MQWQLPSKTFLLGEYAALAGLGAIVLTTKPSFELRLTNQPGLIGIHPESPAGRWWALQGHQEHGLEWLDQTNHCGGLGASSAQFVGAYQATACLQNKGVNPHDLLEAYWQCAWSGRGLRPSGYDVLAQYIGCDRTNDFTLVYIRNHEVLRLSWPFRELQFIIAHTGFKLATHHHLAASTLPDDVERLDECVTTAYDAFQTANSRQLINAVNHYYFLLNQMGLVCEHTQRLVARLQQLPDVLAVKGCGALGADVVVCLVSADTVPVVASQLMDNGLALIYP